MRNTAKRYTALCLSVLLLLGAFCFVGCSDDDAKENKTYTVLLRDGGDGTHYRFIISEDELETEQIPIAVRWQESQKRITMEVKKDPAQMTKEERKALLELGLALYVLSEKDTQDEQEPSGSENADQGTSSDELSQEKPSVWVKLSLMDKKDGTLHEFTYDIGALDASVQSILKKQQEKGPVAVAMPTAVAGMTDTQKTELMAAVISMLTAPNTAKPKATVFVDAGHGYTNSYGVMDKGAGEGTPYYELTGKYESDVNLAIALALRDNLERAGYRVIMSRESEVNEHLPINDRARMIKNSGADFAVSVHCNSFDSLTVNGARVYWHENNANAQQSEALAETLAQAINGISNTTNKEAYAAQGSYAVVRDVHIPSVLVETCFLTGEEDAKLASDPMWIYRMALALFNGIEAHFAVN